MMQRFLFFIMISLTAIGSWAQQETGVYHPFVERGKLWRVHGFSLNKDHEVTDYHFSLDKNPYERDGRIYEALYSVKDNGTEHLQGLFREEGRRVFIYDEGRERELLAYDFTLEVGDEIDLDAYESMHCTVTAVGELTVNGEHLKTITLTAQTQQADSINLEWIEGVGTLSGPLEGLRVSFPNSRVEQLAYVYGSTFLPFDFVVDFAGWRGTNLVRNRELLGSELVAADSLSYEFIPSPDGEGYSLHVYGRMWTHCGPNNYVYCVTDLISESGEKQLRLVKEAMEYTDCSRLYEVDFTFPYFYKAIPYYIIDERGEHLVPVHGNQPLAYRPFIEEGKEWKVGWRSEMTDKAMKVDYYYFEGDTIIDNQRCQKMLCRHEAHEQWGNPEPSTQYVGALYEFGHKVYGVFPGRRDFKLLYDFVSAVGDTVSTHGSVLLPNNSRSDSVSCIITDKGNLSVGNIKGAYAKVALRQINWDKEKKPFEYDFRHPIQWVAGIGNLSGSPLQNVGEYGLEGDGYALMSCTVGDEVLYYNGDIEDGVTPPADEAKKQRLDFTHVVKPVPKSPRRGHLNAASDAVHPITGEYSAKTLTVDMRDLVGHYTVTLRNDDGTVLYRKEIDARNTLGLSTALAHYGHGTFTLTIENGEEQYVATLLIDDETGIATPDSKIVNSKSVNSKSLNSRSAQSDASYLKKWHDLSGRSLSVSSASSVPSVLPKGVYIRNGKKFVVR